MNELENNADLEISQLNCKLSKLEIDQNRIDNNGCLNDNDSKINKRVSFDKSTLFRIEITESNVDESDLIAIEDQFKDIKQMTSNSLPIKFKHNDSIKKPCRFNKAIFVITL